MRVHFVLLSLMVSALIPLIPHPYSLILAFVSAVLLFTSIGKVALVLGTIISGVIVLVPVAFEYSVIDIPWSEFMKPHGSVDEVVPYDFNYLDEEGRFANVKRLEILGSGMNVALSKDATLVRVEKGLYYKTGSEKLAVFSKRGGSVVSPPVESIDVEGMGVKINGYGKGMEIKLNGIKNEIDLEVSEKFDIELTGMNNSVYLKAGSGGNVEVYGLGNDLKVDLTGADFGTVRLEISGTGNRVDIYVPKDGRVRVVKELNPEFMNRVRVIRR